MKWLKHIVGMSRRRWLAVAVVLTVFWAVVHLRPGRVEAGPADHFETPAVAVVRVAREDLSREVTIPAEFRPYQEVALHAKVSGYLEQIGVDFGDQVKAGQLLATLEIPELRDELNNAIATRSRAEADYTNAHVTYERLLAVDRSHPNLVAQQDLDTAAARDSATAAAIEAARADVEKYQAMVGYTRITAPFDGVITRRYADPGALIQAGIASDTQAMPLVRLSDNYRLRLDFPVSVDYVKDIRPGDSVEVRVDSLGGKMFTGKISRWTHQVDESTRTMTTELEVDNPKLEIVPGMYATVVLKVEQHPQALAIPIEAVAPGGRLVCVVNSRNEVEERNITLGLETPTRYEVLSGLNDGDLVMLGNPGQLKPGQKVTVKMAGSTAVL
jgi:RND family efflux transporter MFP subunit